MKNQVIAKYAKDEYINPNIHEKTPQEMLRPRVASNCEVNRTHVFRVKRQTVAIVFVPGVMGSRLEVKQKSKISKRKEPKLWDPDDLVMMVKTFFTATPEKRYELFFDQQRKVITTANADHKHNKRAEEHGWPGVAWSCYGELISSLHDWDTPLKTLLDLPVYAFGYDWVDSNELSGFLLQQFILQHVKADKVIIVTHSMGGLVTRSALAGKGGGVLADKVLGVIHGAQPVHGAPDAYHRQIAGTGAENFIGKIASKVMGASGEHMTAIAPHAPGILQLLPNQFYRSNRGKQAWLHIQDLDNEHEFKSYPQGDPYEEIYLRSHHREYWGLIHGEWFQPVSESPQVVASKLHEPDADTELPDKDLSVTGLMKMYLSKARYLHATIAHYSHPRTVQLFSSGGHTTISEICWRARDITPAVSAAIPQQRHYNTHLSRYASQTSLHPRSFLGEIEEAKPQGYGKFSEIRWRHANGELGEIVPPETRLEDLREPLSTGGMRLFQVWMTASGESVPGITDNAMCHLGDGTVPESSATAMNPDPAAWTPCIHMLPTWQTPSGELKYVTGLANQASHDQFYNDEAAIRAVKQSIKLPQLGVTMYALGRFMLPVPAGLQISGSLFKINAISIDEIGWKKNIDRSEYFKSLWTPVRDEARSKYEYSEPFGPVIQGGLAEEDISALCGHPAMLLCYADSMAGHYIDVHVAMPDVIFRLKEERLYQVRKECLNMEENILNLLRHYRSGSRNVSPDSFFCITGRFEGMKTWYEQTNVSAYHPGNATVPEMSLALNTHLYNRATTPPKSFMAAIGVARSVGIDIQFLRSQRRVLAGMDGLEEIFIMRETKGGDVRSEMTARWTFEGVGKDHDKPRMDIELTCHPDGKEYALRVWDAVMRNFTTVREFYGRRS